MIATLFGVIGWILFAGYLIGAAAVAGQIDDEVRESMASGLPTFTCRFWQVAVALSWPVILIAKKLGCTDPHEDE